MLNGVMMEPFDSQDDRDDSQRKSQESGFQAARGNGSKLHGESSTTQPAPPEKALDPLKDDQQIDELDQILASIFDLPVNSQQFERKPVSMEQRAADVVARSGNLASTDSTFRDHSRRLTRYLGGDPEAGNPSRQAPDVTAASLSLLEESSLIHAMFRAASLAANEKEAGLLAVASIPLILQQYPRVSRALWTAIPGLSLGVEALVRFLHRSEVTRPLIMDLPRLLRGSLNHLAQLILQRHAVSSESVSMILAEQTSLWLASHTRRGREDDQDRSAHLRRPRRPSDEE
jgi:hypothetical protein